ncbi:MAG TPA: chitin disaccharide deacetylase [Bacilli bacterium]|nr:chitin disaccharide deacetylase [Bacilli bacterium]HRU49371.1 chitin disaccharide deacetylase [Bacilli bacterium]
MKLIVNADDFGFTKGVNRGIIEAHKNGIVTSSTVMVTMPKIRHARKLSKKYPNLKLGLHLNMTLGKPLTDCPSLVKPNGEFYKPKENPDVTKFQKAEIKREFLAQYNRFVKLFQKKPTHLDSHLYAHQIYDVVKEVVYELSAEKNIPVRDLETTNYKKACFLNCFKAFEHETTDDILKRLEAKFSEMKDVEVAELMVHPAYIDDYLCHHSSYNVQRSLELEALTSSRIKEMIQNHDIVLTDFEEEALCRK